MRFTDDGLLVSFDSSTGTTYTFSNEFNLMALTPAQRQALGLDGPEFSGLFQDSTAFKTTGTGITIDGIRGTLSANATDTEIKAFVKKLYESDPIFKEIFEDELGLSEDEALAFMYADMSRESGTGTGTGAGKLTCSRA